MKNLSYSLYLTALLLGACSSAGSADPATAASDCEQNAPPPRSPASIAANTVAERAATMVCNVEIVSVDAVDFSDSSLDCPQPDMSYLQVITPGHTVIAQYGDQVFDVRVAGGRALICDKRVAESAARQPSS